MRLGHKEDWLFDRKKTGEKQKNNIEVFLRSKHLLFEDREEQNADPLTMRAEDFVSRYREKSKQNLDEDIVAVLRKNDEFEFDD